MNYNEIETLKKNFPFLWVQAKALLLGFDLVTKDIDLETAKLVNWYLKLRKAASH